MKFAMDELQAREQREKNVEAQTAQRIMDMQKELAEHKFAYAKRIEELSK